MRSSLLAVLVLVALLPQAARAQAPAQPFVMPDTEVRSFTSKDNSHTFRLVIGLPRHYATRNERFPVIYLLDADFAFPLAQEIQRHTTDRGFEKESIVVGIAYPGAEADLNIYERTRTQDYTPTHTPDGGYSAEIQTLSGGAPAFLKILSDELLPMIDRDYRTDPGARMIVGHSFGGLFAVYAMLKQPGMFQDYLVVSPSLWYDNRVMFGVAKSYIAAHKSLPANVFYAVGALEANSESQMVGVLQDWNTMMSGANLAGYRATMKVYDGDTHESVFPNALTRGLRVLSGFAGENAGNRLERGIMPGNQ